MLSDFSFHTVGLSTQPVLQRLMDRNQLSATQINREIQQKHIPFLAAYFDSPKFYVDVMGLTPGEQNDVMKEATTQLAMIECLKIWKKKNCSRATFRALLEMLVGLSKEAIAAQVCRYLKGECLCAP